MLTGPEDVTLAEAIRADHARLTQERGRPPAGLARILRDALLHKTFRCLVSYRLLRASRLRRLPLGLLAAGWHRSTCLSASMELAWQAEIGPGCRILHGFGVVALPCAKIGARATLAHGVGIGDLREPGDPRPKSVGVIEDDCFVGPYSLVWARLGAGSVLASHSTLLSPVPPGSLAKGAPARAVPRPGTRHAA